MNNMTISGVVNSHNQKISRKNPCPICGDKNSHYTRECPVTNTYFSNKFIKLVHSIRINGFLDNAILFAQGGAYLFEIGTESNVNMTSLEGYSDYGVVVYTTKDYKHLVIRYGRFRNEKMFIPVKFIRQMS